jgi:type II secretory pathway component PulM
MSKPATILSRLTPRERLLVSILFGLMLVIGAVWFALLPGLDAVSAAESRRARASDERAYIAQLADQLTAARASAADLPDDQAPALISEAALEFGVQVLSATPEGAGVRIQVDAPNATQLLAWVDAASARASVGVRTIGLQRGEAGALVADVLFSRETP